MPSRPRSWTKPARRIVVVELGQPVLDGRARGELGDRVRVAEHVRRLQVDEVRDREQRGVEAARPRSVTASAGSASITASHVTTASRPERSSARLGVDDVAERGIELAAAPLPHERPRGLDAADAVRDLDELAELREPRRERDRLARRARRASPCRPTSRRRRRARRAPRAGSSSCSPSARAIAAWCVDHVVDLAVAREHEARARSGSGGAAGSRRRSAASPRPSLRVLRSSCVVLVRLQRDVVAEPLRLLVRVRVAPDVDEQRGVVDDRALARRRGRAARRCAARSGTGAARAPSAARSRGRPRARAPRRARPAGRARGRRRRSRRSTACARSPGAEV